jgi:HAD superfamily hydrolase (TIGR01662 family)
MTQASIRAVFFDVGETLVDEGRSYESWADWLGVPRLAFGVALGAVIARGGHHREVFELIRPGFDLGTARERRAAAGNPDEMRESDLYPDVRPCLAALRAQGLRIGIAGNQPPEALERMRGWDLPVDTIGTSAAWGVDKPAPEFFARVVEEAGCPPSEVLYVGDRLDNDVRAAQEAGLPTVFVRRGVWALAQRDDEAVARAVAVVPTLDELPRVVAALTA